MGFRERPEYQDWRDAVFRLFGRKCIRCGHAGNIHTHHVMPVNEYPELAFDPANGVPLCGNCHTEIKGHELAHVDELQRLQRAILGGEAVGVASNAANDAELRERAYAEPSNAEAVGQWFEHSTDSQAVVDFYNTHHEAFAEKWLTGDKETFSSCCHVALHMRRLGRSQDELEFSDEAMRCAEQEGTLGTSISDLASCKVNALEKLGRFPELLAFLRDVVTRFPETAILHYDLSALLMNILTLAGDDRHKLSALLYGDSARVEIELRKARNMLSEEAVRHALKALQLAPDGYPYVLCASRAVKLKGDYASAIRYGKQALALASTDKENVLALRTIAEIYYSNELYSDARSYFRKELEIDDHNVDVIGHIAMCYAMEGNHREALRMAKQGLMLDPQEKLFQVLCRKLGDAVGAPVTHDCHGTLPGESTSLHSAIRGSGYYLQGNLVRDLCLSIANIWTKTAALTNLIPRVTAGSTRPKMFPHVYMVATDPQFDDESHRSITNLSFHVWVGPERLALAKEIERAITDTYSGRSWQLDDAYTVIDMKDLGPGIEHPPNANIPGWEIVKLFTVCLETHAPRGETNSRLEPLPKGVPDLEHSQAPAVDRSADLPAAPVDYLNDEIASAFFDARELENMTDRDASDHWALLAPQLGAAPPQEETEATSQPTRAKPGSSNRPTKQRRVKSHWDLLANELGIVPTERPPAEPSTAAHAAAAEPPSVTHADVRERREVLEESVRHALKAVELAPDEFRHVSWACDVLQLKGDLASALRYGKRALALASADQEKIEALRHIAQVYIRNELYTDARSYLREALKIDDCNVDVIADIAYCFNWEDNNREALRMAKRGLMLDPGNKLCRDIRNSSGGAI